MSSHHTPRRRAGWDRHSASRWSRGPEIPPRRLTQSPVGSPLGHGTGQSRPVLIVDDDDFGRETLGRILEADGHRVLRAANGREALTHLNGGERPGVIVLDLEMPGTDGWTFARRQICNDEFAGIPIIVVSASGAKSLREEMPGVVAHFEKPVAVEALRAAIREHLGG